MKTHILLSSIFLVISVSVFGQIPTSGLVAYYPFNGNANDESGNNINPTYKGEGITLTTDRFGNPDKAYYFDGNTGSYIRMPADNLPTNSRTISLWFNVPDVSNRPGLLGYGGDGNCGTSLFMALNCSGSAQYWTQGHCGFNQAGYSYETAPVDRWVHWVLTINGSEQKIYIDGQLKSTSNTFSGSTAVAGKDLSLGVITYVNGLAPYTDFNVGYLKGKLDEIRIYSSALSDKQVKELYDTESGNLVAWFPFNGNASDESFTANHGTVIGSALTSDRYNVLENAYIFNGISDRIQVPDNNAYDFGDGDFSITSWINLNEIKTCRIVSAGYDSNDGIWGLGLGSHPKWGEGLRINYFVYSGGDYRDFSSNEITGYSLGNWAFVGITKKENTIIFYFNGQQAGTAAIPFVSNANSYLSIGSRQLASGSHIEFLNGKIDELKIYKRTLSEAEIQNEYNSTRNSLVAYYPFNGNANDESGNGNNGTVYGALLSSDRFGIDGQAYSFNGSTDYIDIGNDISLKMTEKLSISVWVKPDVFPLSSYHNIVSDHGDGNNKTKVLRFYKDAIEFLLGPEGSTEARYVFPNSIANKWQHITATYDGSFMRLFVNGSIVDSVSRTGTITANPLPLLIAKSHFNEFFPGSIDEVKIYDRPLSNTEIKQEYDSTRNPLVAYYPFNGNANDESGNGHDGTVIGNSTLTTDRFNENNKAYSFPYLHDRIELANTTNMYLSSGFTLSAWVKYKNINAGIINRHNCWVVNGFSLGQDAGQIWLRVANEGAWNDIKTNQSFVVDQWYMVTGVYDAVAHTGKVYINGQLAASGPANYTNFGTAPITISESSGGCPDGNYPGTIDEVKIYDRPLSEAEIIQEYNSTRNSLVAYFPFNGNANDESGNGNNGTITGALVTPATDRYGQEGKAYKFWFPDYVSVPANSSFFTDEFTVSYWYKVESYWGDRGVLSCVGNKGGYQQVFSAGTTFTYLLGYNFPSGSWFWTNYTVPNTPNTWQHITTTYKKTGDNASVSKLYIDGELKSSDTYDNSIAYPGSDILYIGRNHSDLGLNGELDDVRFYNRVLTGEEVMALHLAETPTAVKNQLISNLKISPNPSDGPFVVDLGSVARKIQLQITDMTGRVIKNLEYSGQQRFTVSLDAPAGIYFLNIMTDTGQAAYKLIKE